MILTLTFCACAIFIPRRVGPASDVRVEITPERVALGKKLAEGIMACGSCHTSGNFAGEPGQDMYLAGSFLMFLAFLTVIGVLLSDLALALLDPRIRLSGGTTR